MYYTTFTEIELSNSKGACIYTNACWQQKQNFTSPWILASSRKMFRTQLSLIWLAYHYHLKKLIWVLRTLVYSLVLPRKLESISFPFALFFQISLIYPTTFKVRHLRLLALSILQRNIYLAISNNTSTDCTFGHNVPHRQGCWLREKTRICQFLHLRLQNFPERANPFQP